MNELKQTVPQDAAIREKIRLASAEYVQAAGLNPPLSLHLLTRHAERAYERVADRLTWARSVALYEDYIQKIAGK